MDASSSTPRQSSTPDSHAHDDNTDTHASKRRRLSDDHDQAQLSRGSESGAGGAGVSPIQVPANAASESVPTPPSHRLESDHGVGHSLSVQHSAAASHNSSAHPSPERKLKPTSSSDRPKAKSSAASTPTGGEKKAVKSKEKERDRAKEKDKKKKPKGKVDELKGEDRSRARSTSSLSNRSPSRDTPDDDDDDNDDIYCICKGEGDDDTMVGCETCDNWFHPGCVDIAAEDLDRLDVYVCAACESKTTLRTTYKRLCAREGCDRTATRNESKFCSSRCAYTHAQSIVEGITNKAALKELSHTLAAYPSPTPSVHIELADDAPPATDVPTDNSEAATLLASLRAQEAGVARALDLVAKRQDILASALAAWEGMASTVSNEPAPAPKRKSKTKRGNEPVEVKPCGWDARLVWDDAAVFAWTGGDEVKEEVKMETEGEEANGGNGRPVCMAGKRCDRHQGWQRTVAYALELEAAGLTRQKDDLAAQVECIEQAGEAAVAARKARDIVHRHMSKTE